MAILMRNLVQTNKQRTTWGAAKGVGAPVLAWLLFLSLPFAAATGNTHARCPFTSQSVAS